MARAAIGEVLVGRGGAGPVV
jgi:hypothetical protein